MSHLQLVATKEEAVGPAIEKVSRVTRLLRAAVEALSKVLLLVHAGSKLIDDFAALVHAVPCYILPAHHQVPCSEASD